MPVAAAPCVTSALGCSSVRDVAPRVRAPPCVQPQNVIDKMVEGRLSKFYAETCLLEQPYLIDDSAGSVSKVLAAAGKELGSDVRLTGFVRFHVGEASADEDA